MTMIDLSLFRAIPEPRGCGKREAGGVYVESGAGPWGMPFYHFLLDPPQPVPPGLDLVNKPRIVPRAWLTGKPETDEAGRPIMDLLIHIGGVHYPWAPDYLQETRLLGASRRVPASLNLSVLNRASRMILAHPRAIPLNWPALRPPDRCEKRMERHDLAWYARHQTDHCADPNRSGPCLFKLWELIPQEQAEVVTEGAGQRPLCLRRIGSKTLYPYHPTGESVNAWSEAFILALPVTGFSLIQDAAGDVNSTAKDKLQEAQEKQGHLSLPVYEVPR